MALPSFDSFIASPYTSWVVAILLAGLALSGRLSMNAAKWMVFLAGILAVVGVYRSEFFLGLPRTPRVLSTVLTASICGLIVYYLINWMDHRPETEVVAARESVVQVMPDPRVFPSLPSITPSVAAPSVSQATVAPSPTITAESAIERKPTIYESFLKGSKNDPWVSSIIKFPYALYDQPKGEIEAYLTFGYRSGIGQHTYGISVYIRGGHEEKCDYVISTKTKMIGTLYEEVKRTARPPNAPPLGWSDGLTIYHDGSVSKEYQDNLNNRGMIQRVGQVDPLRKPIPLM